MKFLIVILLIVSSVHLSAVKHKSISCITAGFLPTTTSNKGFGVSSAGTAIINDQLILIGGSNFSKGFPWEGGKKVFLNDIFIAQKHKNDSLIWTKHPGQFPVSISNLISIPDNNTLYLFGGINENGANKQIYKLYFDTNDSLHIEIIASLPEQFSPNGGAVYNHKIILTGHNGTHNILYFYDPKTDIWDIKQGIPGAIRSDAMVTILHEQADSSRLYVFGGRHIEDKQLKVYQDFWYYSLQNQKWYKGGKIDIPGVHPVALMASTAVTTADSEIIFFGGDEGIRFRKRFKLEVQIRNSKESHKEKYRKKLNNSFVTHTGFSNKIIKYNITENSWKMEGEITGQQLPVATTALWWRNKIIIPGGELKPGIRSNKILEIDPEN